MDYLSYYKTQVRYNNKGYGYRCKVCKESGHNKQSCPHLKKKKI